MKTVIYITKNKVWVGEIFFEWDGQDLDRVLIEVKKQVKISEARVVLGNDLSIVVAIRAGDVLINRENVLNLVRSWMPFPIDNDCFDWKEMEIAYKEKWLQVIAVEKEFLEKLSLAVKKSGVRVEMVTAIGVVLGAKTQGRESPVVVKWDDKEKLSVLAVNGLVDQVTSDINDEDMMTYAKQKWGLAVNPEEIVFKGREFDLIRSVMSEKTKGDDELVLNLPILKDVTEKKEKLAEGSVLDFEGEKDVVETVKKKTSKLWVYLLMLFLALVAGALTMYKTGIFEQVWPKDNEVAEVTPAPTLTPEITPEPTPSDLTMYSVQVLNGSGVTGEAARIREVLLGFGFDNVDVGNFEATTEGQILTRGDLPKDVMTFAQESVSDYIIGDPILLADDVDYDLVIILGTGRNL
jgi:hypothetical protein